MGERIEAVRADLEVLHEILGELREEKGRSSELLALTRWSLNSVLWCGTAASKTEEGNAWRKTFQVPFASVAFADPNKLGLTISTSEATTQGPGVIVAPAGNAGCVPLVGTQLVITPGTAGLFVVCVFASQQPFSWAMASDAA